MVENTKKESVGISSSGDEMRIFRWQFVVLTFRLLRHDDGCIIIRIKADDESVLSYTILYSSVLVNYFRRFCMHLVFVFVPTRIMLDGGWRRFRIFTPMRRAK